MKKIISAGTAAVISLSCFAMGMGNVSESMSIYASTVYSVNCISGEGGRVIASSVSVEEGGYCSITIQADEGYMVSAVYLNGVSQNINGVQGTIVTLSDIDRDITVSAEFEKQSFEITSSYTGSGTIILSSEGTVNYNENLDIQIIPDDGWKVSDLKINGLSYGENIGSVSMQVVCDVNIEVVFERTGNASDVYTFTSVVTGNGTVTSDNPFPAYGENISITVKADSDSIVSWVKINGITQEVPENTAELVYTADVYGNVTAEVGFEKKKCPVNVTVYGNGTYSNNAEYVEYGNSYSNQFLPESGWYLSKLVVNGTEAEGIYSVNIEEVTGSLDIEVYFEEITGNMFTVSAVSQGNGTVTADKSAVSYGDTVNFEVKANDGYKIESITYGDKIITFDETTVSSAFSIENVVSDTYVTAVFAPIILEVNYTVTGSGTGTVTGAESVNMYSSYSAYFTPDSGSVVSDVKVNGVSYGVCESINIEEVTAALEIEVVFSKADEVLLKVSEAHNSGGSVTLEKTSAYAGTNCKYEISADDGYYIRNISVNDKTVEIGNYTSYYSGAAENITEDTVIEVEFAKVEFNVTVNIQGNGTATNGSCVLSANEDFSTEFIADEGSRIKDVIVNGESKGAISGLSFGTVSQDLEITVIFEEYDGYCVSYTQNIDGGKVTITPESVSDGGSAEILIEVYSGYELESVTVNGENIGANTMFTINNIYQDYLIEVVYKQVSGEYKCGDTNLDGKISSVDLILLKGHLLETKTLEGQALQNADVNSDGRISVTDITKLKSMLLS